MGKILKQNRGVALVMVIIVTTCVILVGTTLLNLSYRNYLLIKAHGNRNASYYIADYGAEKVIKNIETVIESAKIYANEMLREEKILSGNSLGIILRNPVNDSPIYDKTPYEYLMNYATTGDSDDKAVQDYFSAYEKYYKYFIEVDSRGINSVTTTGWVPVDIDSKQLTQAEYFASLDGPIVTSDYTYNFNVTSKSNQNGQDKYERQIKMKVGLNPWGYKQLGGSAITTTELTVVISKNELYSSPQWSNALASSGDIVIKGGEVIVNGDIFVNGKTPKPQTGKSIEGSKYGGLVVGKDDQAGKLTVEGNILATGYVHTNFPGSEIAVKMRDGFTDINDYKGNIRKIYYNSDAAFSKYTENSDNLNYDSTGTIMNGNPLSAEMSDEDLSNLGKKQVHDEYIKYLKYTYEIQSESGGFIYANSVQIEKDPQGLASSTAQKITTDGSVIIYDNLEIDSNGEIQVGENYYGFKSGSTTDNEYDRSSSIITNHIQGKVSIGKRLYAAGVAYVTAFNESLEPYQTGEAISLYKNFYAYRVQLEGENFSTNLYNPFRFLVIPETVDRFFHVKKYDQTYTSGLTIGNGGSKYDKDLVELKGITEATEQTSDTADDKAIYDNTASNDMGYSEGILMGKNAKGNYFIGNVKNESPDPATGSLIRDAFRNYIIEKYATLMEMKALKSINGEIVTINDLTTNDAKESFIKGKKLKYYSPDSTSNYIAVDGNLQISSDGSKIIISTFDVDTDGSMINLVSQIETSGSTPLTFSGIIFATGKIVIDCGATSININGAVISAKPVAEDIAENATDTEGIIFSGAGTKTIEYNRDIILEIFKNSEEIKTLLTSKRGSVEMMKKVFSNNSVPGFNTAVGSVDLIESTADKYETSDEISIDTVTIINGGVTGASSKNYRIFSWKVEK